MSQLVEALLRVWSKMLSVEWPPMLPQTSTQLGSHQNSEKFLSHCHGPRLGHNFSKLHCSHLPIVYVHFKRAYFVDARNQYATNVTSLLRKLQT